MADRKLYAARRRRNAVALSFSVAATVFGTFGNDIFDTQKEAYIFRNFSANVRNDLLEKSWTPETANSAKYPRLDANDTFSQQLSSFYVEDGSYVRMRSLQLGYTLPAGLGGNLSMLGGSRIYLSGENLFTVTDYDGLDPELRDASDQGTTLARREYYQLPPSRQFLLSMRVTF